MNKLIDKELVKDFTTDKEKAFRAFFDAYYVRLCMYAVQITDDFSEKRERIPLEELLIDDEYFYACEEMDESERESKEKELKKALDELPEQERNALYRVVIENKKYKEAAEELHISINTLKTYLSRALKRLRKNEKLMLLIFFV